MSLTPEAIDRIGELVKSSTALDLRADAVALPGRVEIHDLEKFHPQRRRFRGEMETAVISEFLSFVAAYGNEQETMCFVDADEMSACAIIDAGTQEKPLHQEFSATVGLNKTAVFQAITSMVGGNAKPQKSFAEFMEDWHSYITPVDGAGDAYPLKNAVQAIRNMTIEQYKKTNHTQESLKAERGTLESISAVSTEKIPALLLFKCIPYHGLQEREIKLRLNVIMRHDELTLSLGYPLELQDREEMAEEFKDILVDGMPKNLKTFIGSFK